MSPLVTGPLGRVLWKDLQTGQWKGPDPVIMWGKGHACIFPEGAFRPIWVPERAIRHGGDRTQIQATEDRPGGATTQKEEISEKDEERPD